MTHGVSLDPPVLPVLPVLPVPPVLPVLPVPPVLRMWIVYNLSNPFPCLIL
jgi:hypothetical protein